MLVGEVRWAMVSVRANLDVVGREEMVLLAAEGLEVPPRLSRDRLQIRRRQPPTAPRGVSTPAG